MELLPHRSSTFGYATPTAMLYLLVAALLFPARATNAGSLATADEEGWSIERMLEEYGDSDRRSLPTWPMLIFPDENQTERSAGLSESEEWNSWLGGMSQYYGAGGVSPIDSSAGVLTSRFNTMVPGFGESGSRSLRPRPNTTLDDGFLRAQNSLLNRVVTILWAANTLRDNIITVFGYILNLPNNTLNADLYTSLYHIHQEVRYRRFAIVPLVKNIREMCRHSPTNQFKNLFREMKKVSRPFMKSAIDFWLKALEDDVIDMDEILRPNGGPLVVDFIEGIDPSVLKELAHPPVFPEETQQRVDPEAKLLMGSVVANTLAAIIDGSLPLTQTLFALLLLSRPAESVVPQRMEAERYISDSLRLRKVKGWRDIAKQAESDRGRGSYHYIRAILWAMAESHDVEKSLQESARLVYTYIEPSVATYSNHYYSYTSSIMSRPTIDILHILKAITPSEYPEDVVDARNRLKYYIESGYLDMEFIVKGFNRFDHVKPINLVIAILKRIELRLPKIPHEIKSSVKYLKVYLIFKKFLSSMSPHIPKDFLDAPFLLDSFTGPNMPKRVRELVRKLEASLRKERLPAEKLIKEISVEECSRPRQCILNVYRRIVKHKYIKGHAYDLMVSLITSLDINGEPLTPPRHPEFEIKSNKRKKCARYKKKDWVKIVSKQPTSPKPRTTPISRTTANFILTSPSTNSVEIITTGLQSVIYSSNTSLEILIPQQVEEIEGTPTDMSIYPGAPEPSIQFPMYKETELKEKPDYSAPSTCLPVTEIGTVEDTKIRPIREFLKVPQLYEVLGYSFRPQTYTNKLQLIIAILKRAVSHSMVKFDNFLCNTMKEFLYVLQNLPRRPQIIYQIAFPNVTEDFEHKEANYEEPYKNLPKCHPGSIECEKMHPIRLFLTDEDLYYKLGPYFRPSLYRTKGKFLQALLKHAINIKDVHKNALLYKAIKQFLSYLKEAHVQPIEVSKTPFPNRDTIKDHEPPNWRHPVTLLPKTIPGTPEHIKMRPLRLFLARTDFWKIMGSEFQPRVYQTKGDLLFAIVKHALTRQWVKEDSKLYNTLLQYHEFLLKSIEPSGGIPQDIKINMQTLVKALPYPNTTEEEIYLRNIRELFQNQQFLIALAPVLVNINNLTRGSALKTVIKSTIERQHMIQLDEQTLKALEYFKDKVFQQGYGAQSVDYVVLKKKIYRIKLSVLDLFRAINHARLSQKERLKVKHLIDFVSSYKFDPNKYLNGFKFEKFTTKGDFLKDAFEHMCKLEFIRPQLKSDMMFLKNYIMADGPGGETVSHLL